jgi:hypothetical protein
LQRARCLQTEAEADVEEGEAMSDSDPAAWYWPQDVKMEAASARCNRITREFEEFIAQTVFAQSRAENERLEADILRAIELQGWQCYNRLIIVEDKDGYRAVASLLRTNIW